MITYVIEQLDRQSDKDFALWLYNEFKNLMFCTAKKYLNDSHAVEDVVQDSILNILRHIDTLQKKERCVLTAYIVITVKNTAISHLRAEAARKGQSQELPEDGEHDFAPIDIPLEELVARRELMSHLEESWELMTEHDRILLEGKYILGYNDRELAQLLGCAENSVRMKLFRARRRAFALLSNYAEAEQ